jgi:hypothetical protein
MKKSLIASLVTMFVLTVYGNATVYEDGTNVSSWGKLDALPASVSSVYDSDRDSDVIEFQGQGFSSAYIYGYGATEWGNTTEKTLKWSMKYSEDYAVYVRLMTTEGFRFLKFTPDGTEGKKEVYIEHALGADTKDGTWHDFEINLEEALQEFEPDNSIISVNGIIFRGSGRVDDIELTGSSEEVNQAPVAVAKVSDVNISGDEILVTFDASGSYDPDGNIIDYKWEENNETISDTESFSLNTLSLGTHDIVLTVTDDDGLTSTDTISIDVGQITTMGLSFYTISVNDPNSDINVTYDNNVTDTSTILSDVSSEDLESLVDLADYATISIP